MIQNRHFLSFPFTSSSNTKYSIIIIILDARLSRLLNCGYASNYKSKQKDFHEMRSRGISFSYLPDEKPRRNGIIEKTTQQRK